MALGFFASSTCNRIKNRANMVVSPAMVCCWKYSNYIEGGCE
jgi:hypothetical protein